MAYNTNEERLKVRGSEQITRDLKVNRDAYINGKLEANNIENKGDLRVNGQIIAGKDVSVAGDLYVNGTEYITNTETAQTTDNYLVLRHNQTGALANGEHSGVAVHNYAVGKTATITADKDGTWRVADNTETDTNYTNISSYNGVYYTGLTRTATTVISGMKTAFDEDELDESVYYNTSYYHFDGNNWFPVSLSSNRLTLGSAVTSTATINALNALTKHDLVYFRTLTVTTINEVENQPLLTRAEATNLTGGQALTWDATNQKAVGKTIDTTVASGSSNLITSGAVSTCVTNAINALDAAEVGGTNKYISKICEKDGKITATAGTIDTAVTANSTNLITSGAVKTCVDNAIGALDVASVGGSGKYISAISETDGKITATASDIASTYSSSGTAPINGTGVNKALQTLDVASVGGAGKYISAISETDGKISATATSMDTAPTANSTNAATSGGIKTAIDTAEANAKCLANATGTLAIAHGGTGVTSQENINCNIIANLAEGSLDVTDGTMFVSSYASDNGFADTNAVNKPYKRTFSHVWNYIKGKISSVLGLTETAYGGKAATAGTADQANKGKNGSAYCAFGTNAFNSTAFTTCTGTVTIADKAATNASTPVALCTGATTVGKSGSCGLNFNTCTGVLVMATLNATNVCGSSYIRAPVAMSAATSGASKVNNVTIRACCTNASCTLTCRDFVFCGSTGYMHGNVCGNLCGTASSAVNSTCFGGCTFAQACTAIRSGLTSCTGTVTSIKFQCAGTDKSTVTTTGTINLSANAWNANATISTTTYPGACCTGTVVASDIANFITMSDVTACGYTTCKGTVTILDKVAANSNTPVALCTGATAVGKSGSCGLNFNTCTGVLSSAQYSGTNVTASGWSRAPVFMSLGASGASAVTNIVLRACCTNASCALTCRNATFCGSNGILYLPASVRASGVTALTPAASASGNVTITAYCCNASALTTRTFVFCGSSNKLHANICGSADSAASATNSTCFGGCTFAQACTAIRSGLTSCTGTVTVANVAADATGCKSIALMTGDTTVGNSKTCANLLYNVNGQIIIDHPQTSSTDTSRTTYINNGSIYRCYRNPNSVAICDFTICAGRQDCAACGKCWVFCDDGYMHGNVCGTLNGTFLGTIEKATNACNACCANKVCITCVNTDHSYAVLFACECNGNQSIHSNYVGLSYNACCNALTLGNNSCLDVFGSAYIQDGVRISSNCFFCGNLCGNVNGRADCAVCIPNSGCTCWYRIYVG